jgi:hypothetical protein
MTPQPRVPDWLLERIALDELPPGQTDELARRMAADPTAQARLAALRASNQEIVSALPPAQVAAEVERRRRVARAAEPAQPRPRAWLAAAGAMATAAAVLALVLLPGRDGGRGLVPPDEITRVKGEPQLLIHRKRGEEVERLERDALVRAGDLLQIAYVAAGRAHGVILSIDGAGAVTLHHPTAPDGETALASRGAVELAHAYELDDAPGFERFFFVTAAPASDRPAGGPVDVTLVLDQARALARDPAAARSAPLALPDSFQQASFLLRKETRP